MKKYALIIFVISLLVLFSGVHLLLPSDEIGIIGGADRPTANFLIGKILKNGYGLLILFGLPTAFCSLFALILSHPIKKCCSIPTSATALGLSACASLGACALLIFASCFIMTDPSKHPIAFPASVACGMVALIGFALLMFLYCKLRGKKPSVPGIFFDVVFSLMYMPAFFRSYNYIYSLLSNA